MCANNLVLISKVDGDNQSESIIHMNISQYIYHGLIYKNYVKGGSAQMLN